MVISSVLNHFPTSMQPPQIMAELPKIAEEAVKKIDSKLECSICLDNFKQPKLLPCFHIFCKSPCLERLVVQNREGKSLHCPTCRHLVCLPDNGVAGLQTDFHIDHLFEIRESLNKAKESQKTSCENCKKFPATGFCRDCRKFVCDKCTELHQMWEDFAGHKIVGMNEVLVDATKLLPTKNQVPRCKKHSSKKLKIYCESCSELICSDCTVRLHQGHNFDLVGDVFPKHKEEIVSSLKPVRENLNKVNLALKVFDTRAKEINNQRETVEADINREIDRQHQILDQRRVQLVGSLDMLTQQNLKGLATQRDHVEVLHAKMSSCLEYAEGGLETGTEGEVLAMKAPVLERIEQITAEFDPATIQPKTEADIELVTDGLEQVSQANREFGELTTTDSASVENSYATGNGSKYATTGKQATVELHAMTRRNKKCDKKLNITAELVHTKSRATIECEVKQENGRHKITYQPARRGKHNLHVRINGEHIRGSPYPIAITPSPQSLRKPVRVVRGLGTPYGITTNSKGQVLVAELKGNCISVLTPEGEKIHTFGSQGSGEGQLNYPCGIAVDRDDNIYVVDNNNHRIQKFTPTGKFIAAVGNRGRNHLQFGNPVGICFNKTNNNLYVCDQGNNRIQVLSTDLTFVRCFGSKGSRNGQFQNPLYVAFDDANNLYVTDCDNHRVQVFTADGQFLRAFTNKANGEQLQYPLGIAIDSSNTVYVSERDRHCVSVFTPQGEYITSFGTKGAKEGQFNYVRGLSVDQNDSIIVSDHINGRLQIF